MTAVGGSGRSLRILYFGMPTRMSATVLRDLIHAEYCICAVVVPGESVPYLVADRVLPFTYLEPYEDLSLPLVTTSGPPDILTLAWRAGIPVLAVQRLDAVETVTALRDLNADVACVACFNRRIPAAMLGLPQYGFLNVHPSLLPAFRGPEPLFWNLRNGAPYGVTIHYMDDGFDTGDIVAQKPVALSDGLDGDAIEDAILQHGTRLLMDALDELGRGVLRRTPQPDGGSAFGSPLPEDFALSATWSARHAFNFMRGTAHWGQYYRVAADGEAFNLTSAIRFAPESGTEPAVSQQGDTVAIRFNPGVLHARLA